MTAAWQDSWLRSGIRARAEALWRGVEAQHIVATMRLVDDLAEQEELERLLESSKPPLPESARGKHFLLSTPFRYRSPHASRFRAPADPGIWYGAAEIDTACAEVAYWKWRFVMDSAGLARRPVLTGHTLFQAHVDGSCIDLLGPPWSKSAQVWAHSSDYSACQQLAREARGRAVAWIRYSSARRVGGTCGAALDPAALSIRKPMPQQTWACKTTPDGVFMRHANGDEAFEFPASQWG